MADLDFEAEVRNEEDVEEALKDGLKRGLRESGNWLQREGRKKARDEIRSTDRIWRRKLYYGWDTSTGGLDGDAQWSGELRNEAPHAEVVEDGLDPGEANPSVQDIIPWVSDKLDPRVYEGVDLSDWNDELAALAKEYRPGMVMTAFAVKNHLEEDGYPGIGFMDKAETYLSRYGPMVVKRKVEKHMERELRSHGLK